MKKKIIYPPLQCGVNNFEEPEKASQEDRDACLLKAQCLLSMPNVDKVKINKFTDNLKNIKGEQKLNSNLAVINMCLQSRRRKGSKIKLQPTSISRAG